MELTLLDKIQIQVDWLYKEIVIVATLQNRNDLPLAISKNILSSRGYYGARH